ncbi:hypothetical protein HS088_TW21G01375 [Tripterygium wilfordii]|uniref:Uncharacterized protein n=1 Tax=Tripterygium wilfordii TaxID=458696 RepID=A0A7J7C622_TRIWF|nr:uncharacterized protein LOC119990197 [Tripterygium wilfordii]KAF5729216.1 hypothetical protein HS088_TW21G01375 [Tripterygium wilfordii]
MGQMCLVWWSRSNKRGGETEATHISDCCSSSGCLTKLMKRLKKQGRMLRATTGSGKSSLQCRYDPLSYSLNFDTTSGFGSLSDDVDYYQFRAFSSKFVANPRMSTTSH